MVLLLVRRPIVETISQLFVEVFHDHLNARLDIASVFWLLGDKEHVDSWVIQVWVFRHLPRKCKL